MDVFPRRSRSNKWMSSTSAPQRGSFVGSANALAVVAPPFARLRRDAAARLLLPSTASRAAITSVHLSACAESEKTISGSSRGWRIRQCTSAASSARFESELRCSGS
eukprot:scaffold27979_cov28-Tisochrysis_lutea.AAC.2